jgi:hypothetical protein
VEGARIIPPRLNTCCNDLTGGEGCSTTYMCWNQTICNVNRMYPNKLCHHCNPACRVLPVQGLSKIEAPCCRDALHSPITGARKNRKRDDSVIQLPGKLPCNRVVGGVDGWHFPNFTRPSPPPLPYHRLLQHVTGFAGGTGHIWPSSIQPF